MGLPPLLRSLLGTFDELKSEDIDDDSTKELDSGSEKSERVYGIFSRMHSSFRTTSNIVNLSLQHQRAKDTNFSIHSEVSVSKRWKSFIDSSDFIKGFGARNTQPHSHILSYKTDYFMDEPKYICLVEDDIETFKVQKQEFAPFVMSPLLKRYHVSYIVGACHGLLCLLCDNRLNDKRMAVIWNPCIGKSIGIVPYTYSQSQTYSADQLVFGFGVCPVTRDPTVVKIKPGNRKPW
ncbi:hypothetical protein Tco_0424668, partial [Tanacetum coccineum]